MRISRQFTAFTPKSADFRLPWPLPSPFLPIVNPFTSTFALFLLIATPLQAQIYADVETSEGTFTIKLDYVNSPRTVGNFIGLATGSKAWIDSTTGAVKTNTPYYNGIIFHRVIAGFMNQTGSQKGDGTDGPGYVFLDEFTTSDFSAAYTVACANSGPQTNGSQFFVTVVPTTHLNNIHTVFGTVPADEDPDDIVAGSRGVINAINDVPVTGSTPDTDVVILTITIRRIGAEAIAFDESAQSIPTVAAQTIDLNFPGLATDPQLGFSQAASTTFNLALSGDLQTWDFEERYLDPETPAPLTTFDAGPLQAIGERQFYHPSLTTWPADAVFPDSLENRTFTADTAVDPEFPFTFIFDASGVTGTWDYPNPDNPLSGNITDSLVIPDGYGCHLIMILSGINYNRWDFNRIGMDSSSPTVLSGRHSGSATSTNPLVGGSLSLNGTHTLTR